MHYHLDLGELIRECQTRRALNFLTHLPRNSLTMEVLMNDREFVVLLETPDEDDESSKAVRLSDFSPEVEALYNVTDRLSDIVSGVIGLGGKRPPKIPAMRRPLTALKDIQFEKRMAEHKALVARVLPPDE